MTALQSTGLTRRWTADEIETVRLNYAAWPNFVIGYLLDRSEHGMSRIGRKLGLAKTDAFHQNPHAHLWNGADHPKAIASRIKPGNVPANKGKKMPGFAVGRMAETQFKKGRAACDAANYLPIGTEKFDQKRNVLMRKVTDDPSIFPVARWKPVHVLVWTATHGAVPKGHIVVFKRGLKTLLASEITEDKLELVTLAENMRRNSYHNNYPKEVGQAIYAKTLLTRAINRATRGVRHD